MCIRDRRSARFVVSGGILTIDDPNDSLTGWHMITTVIKDGTFSIYVDGVLDSSPTWLFQGLDKVTNISIGRGVQAESTDGGPDATFDEATFSTVPRSADWLLASYNNQKQSSTYLNFETLVGPISLNDDEYTKIYGKKDTAITSYTVAHSGSGCLLYTSPSPRD